MGSVRKILKAAVGSRRGGHDRHADVHMHVPAPVPWGVEGIEMGELRGVGISKEIGGGDEGRGGDGRDADAGRDGDEDGDKDGVGEGGGDGVGVGVSVGERDDDGVGMISQLPPVDRGRGAWTYLAVAFLVEGLCWGERVQSSGR